MKSNIVFFMRVQASWIHWGMEDYEYSFVLYNDGICICTKYDLAEKSFEPIIKSESIEQLPEEAVKKISELIDKSDIYSLPDTIDNHSFDGSDYEFYFNDKKVSGHNIATTYYDIDSVDPKYKETVIQENMLVSLLVQIIKLLNDYGIYIRNNLPGVRHI